MKFLIIILVLSSSVFAQDQEQQYCGTIYQGEYMEGEARDLYHNDRLANLNELQMGNSGKDWDNRISSITVQTNCKVVAFQFQNMGKEWETEEVMGRREVYSKKSSQPHFVTDLGSFDNKISSLMCMCRQ